MNETYPTHFIARRLSHENIPLTDCDSICVFCSKEITHGIPFKKTVSSNFTNLDIVQHIDSDYVCSDCYVCLKEPKLRRFNYIATNTDLIYFKRSDIENYLFNPPEPPFIFSITESMKKHSSFKARINHSQKLFYVQKEDEQILFSPSKYIELFNTMKRLYTTFSKTAIKTGNYKPNYIKKYGLHHFIRDETIIKKHRGSQVFNLLLYALNLSDEQLKKIEERKKAKQVKLIGL